MQGLSVRILGHNVCRRVGMKCCAVLATILFLTNLGCTGHVNPFDPKTKKTKGDPFELNAYTGYGKIILEWDSPTYPDGNSFPFDFFRGIRENRRGNKDTLDLGKQMRFEDTEILGDSLYQYQIAAVRGNTRSDFFPAIAPAFAYPMPIDSFYLGATATSPFGIDFSSGPPTAIGFEGNIKFVAFEGYLCEIRPGATNVGFCQDISNPTSDMALLRSTIGDSVHIIPCSALNQKIDFLVWTEGSLIHKFQKKYTNRSPQTIATEEIGKAIFVADDRSDSLFELNLYTGNLQPTGMRTGPNPLRLIAASNPPRLFCTVQSPNNGAAFVVAFDITTQRRLDSIHVNLNPIDMWLGPDSRLYVACANGGTVVIIDPSTLAKVGEIPIVNPNTESNLFPISVTGFADAKNRHPGVLAVVACSGYPCTYPAFLLYYSLVDRKLERYLNLPPTSQPGRASFLARMNMAEGHLYTLLFDRIWVCQFK